MSRTLIACLLGSLALSGCSEESTLPIGVVLSDPRDERHLIVNVGTCSKGGDASAEEKPTEVVITVTGQRIEPLCASEQLDLRLDAPLGERTVIDASTGNSVTVEPALHLDPASTVPRLAAECTNPSVTEAVAREVDGGLRHQLLACGPKWMAVFTYQNACPATGDPLVDPDC